ncbi:MAG: hypothetical protein RL220_1880 [Bacteroidota bacterium]
MIRFYIALISVLAFAACSDPTETPVVFREVKSTHPNGKPNQVQVYSTYDSTKVGAEEYYDNGTLKVKMPYLNDLREGETYTYYKDGKPWSLNTFKRDTLDGPYKTWHENGQLYWDGIYSRGLEKGVWTIYDDQGKVIKTINFEEMPDSLKGNVNIPRL